MDAETRDRLILIEAALAWLVARELDRLVATKHDANIRVTGEKLLRDLDIHT